MKYVALILLLALPVRADFTIGSVLSLTGPTAEYGVAMRNSMLLALEDSGRTDLTLRFEDAGYDTRRAVDAFYKLVDIDRVDLVYVWGVTFCKALAPLAEARRVVMIGQCVDRESSEGRKYVLRFMNYTDEYIATAARYMRRAGLRRIGIVLAENAYLEENALALERQHDSVEVVRIERFQPSDLDFRSAILRMRRSNVDAVAVYLLAGQITQFYRQMSELRWKVPTLGTNFFESASELRMNPGLMDGAVFPNNQIRTAFRTRYRETFGTESQLGFGALAYEFISIVAQKHPGPGAEEILAVFEEPGEHSGAGAGPYRFVNSARAGKYLQFPIVMKRVSGNDVHDIPESMHFLTEKAQNDSSFVR